MSMPDRIKCTSLPIIFIDEWNGFLNSYTYCSFLYKPIATTRGLRPVLQMNSVPLFVFDTKFTSSLYFYESFLYCRCWTWRRHPLLSGDTSCHCIPIYFHFSAFQVHVVHVPSPSSGQVLIILQGSPQPPPKVVLVLHSSLEAGAIFTVTAPEDTAIHPPHIIVSISLWTVRKNNLFSNL